MGLLDQFSGLSDDQSQGLLAFGANALQNSGPSLIPRGFGQILGSSIGAYQGSMTEAKKRKQDEDQQRQMMALRALQIQEAQGGLDDHARSRQQAETLAGLQQEYAGRSAPGAQPAMPDMSQMQGGPTNANAAALTQAQAQQPAAGKQESPYEQAMGYAQFLQSKGMVQQAMSVAKEAQSLRPKFSTTPQVVRGPDGKPMLIQTADDGTAQPIQGGYGVAEKLGFHNIGGSTVGVDPYTGQAAPGATMRNTQSPDSAAATGTADRRLAFERSQVGRPVFNAEVGGFVSPPNAAAPNGTLTPLDGYTKPDKPLTESQGKASLFASRMQKADAIMTGLNQGGTKTPSAIKSGLESVPLIGGALGTVGNYAASDEQQRLEQSQRDFVNAVLRQESGAAISEGEFTSAQKQYFPQRGDSDNVIAQKAANRATAIQGMALQSGGGAAKLTAGGTTQPAKKSAIKGQVSQGYRFKGGDPADQSNWEKI